MNEDELLGTLLTNLDNLHCYNCGKSAAEFTKEDDSLLGCLRFDTGDASVGEENFVYWECPECEKESIKINNLIIELSNLSSGSMSTIKRELKILIEDYGYRKMVSGCINVKEGE